MELPTHIVAAGGIIFNNDNQVLLVKNPRKGWEYPGGQIEIGETVPDGLKREILEESGVIVELNNIVGIYSNTKKKKGYNGIKIVPTIVTIDFICKYISGKLTTSNESSEVRWFSLDEAKNIINPRQQYRFNNALSYKSQIFCCGYQANKNHEIIVHQEYKFKRWGYIYMNFENDKVCDIPSKKWTLNDTKDNLDPNYIPTLNAKLTSVLTKILYLQE